MMEVHACVMRQRTDSASGEHTSVHQRFSSHDHLIDWLIRELGKGNIVTIVDIISLP